MSNLSRKNNKKPGKCEAFRVLRCVVFYLPCFFSLRVRHQAHMGLESNTEE